MFIRTISAAVVACGLLFASTASFAQNQRGPSTAEERQKALDIIHSWQQNPLGPKAKDQTAWVLRWVAEVPDLTVDLCSIFDQFPKGDKKDSSTVFAGMFMAQTAFVIENPDKRGDLLAEYQAGVEGALHVYEVLLKANPKDRQPYFDDLIQRRDQGTLTGFVKERVVAAGCKK